jgi:p-cumate 2,3-dioxygenase subunit beta
VNARAAAQTISLAEVERFLIEEVALLDDWKLDEWFSLMQAGARYLVPGLNTPDSDPDTALFLVADDYTSLRSRIAQLNGRSAWAETPRSRTRHQVTNVRILEADEHAAYVTANFVVWRFQNGASDAYVGKYLHRMVRTADGLRFTERRCQLDLETLRPHGKLSIIL